MRNPVFKAQVAELFEKVAWPNSPGAVRAQVSSRLGDQIGRGQAIAGAVKHLVGEAPEAGRGVLRVLGGIMRPASSATAQTFYKGLEGVKNFASLHPGVARGAVGLALLAPILGASASGSQHSYEDRLMNLREDPSRDVTASLEDFLEKKAEAPAGFSGPLPWGTMGVPLHGMFQHSLVGGLASGAAQGIVGSLGKILAGGYDSLKDTFISDRRRKQIFTTLLQQDVVLHDALERNPINADVLKEAFATMCRFAPSLSLDVNAVRSFLREAVIGGGGVNYASIKNLVETEKALHSGGNK